MGANVNTVSLPGLPDVDLELNVDRRTSPVTGGPEQLSGVAARRGDQPASLSQSVERIGGTRGPEADNPQL
jgi:hypothetical protein